MTFEPHDDGDSGGRLCPPPPAVGKRSSMAGTGSRPSTLVGNRHGDRPH
jgi:hypothetical protein